MNNDELNALKARLLDCLQEIGQGRCGDTVERVWRWVETPEAYAKFKLERERYK